ncbi:MAG: three-Cys-motif partner protein TcmP [Pirellula sp.]
MTHRAGDKFFDHKRLWSLRKDEILSCYLAAYLPKIMMLRKPVLIVDAFAGPGRFKDSADGSPRIICRCVRETQDKNLTARQPVSVWCIEKIPTLHSQLVSNIDEFTFAVAHNGAFGDFAAEIAAQTRTSSVFLYVDPFTVEGLVWSELNRIFAGLGEGNSVEILLNLNSPSFVRRGLALLKSRVAAIDEDETAVDAEDQVDATFDTLDAVAGGRWWRELLSSSTNYPTIVQEFVQEYCKRLSSQFSEVVSHAVKAKPHHQVPKYHLVFGTRHLDGLTLMNDEMVKSRRELADMAMDRQQPTLFETRSEELVPDVDRLPAIVLEFAK